jgi:hypothetical protein
MYVARLLVACFVVTFVLGFGYGKVSGIPWHTADVAASAPTQPTAAPLTAAPTTLSTAPPTTAPTTTLGPPPGGRVPTPADPLRVVMAGDSVMAGLNPPVKAALEAGGSAQVHFVLTPSILRDPTIRFTWQQQLDQFDPDVVVMFVGTWESREVETHSGQTLTLGDPGWKESYESEILDPWINFISAKGARVIWIGSPTVGGNEANLLFGTLNQVFRDLPNRFPNVTYLDGGPPLQGPDFGFHPIITDPDGKVVRTRQIDGLHLCPDGAALLAKPLLEQLIADWRVPVAYGWQGLPWSNDPSVYPPASCPAP